MSAGSPRLKILGAGFVVVIALLTAVIFSGIFRAPFAPATTTITAEFDRAGQLYKGDQVRLEGNIDGKVTKVAPAGDGSEALRATLAVEEEAGEIYADARARLRFKSVLGGSYYVELQRGTPGAGPLGDRVIARDRTNIQTELEDVTDIFRNGAVTGATTMPGELATALSDTQSPVELLKTLDDVSPDAIAALDAVRGQQKGQDIPELIDNASVAVAALDTPMDDIRTVVGGAAATLRTTGGRADEIRETLAAGPGVTFDLANTLVRVDGTLDTARGLIGRLEEGVPQIAPTLRDLRPTLVLTAETLENAKPVLRQAPATVQALTEVGPRLKPLLDGLRPGLDRTAETILPYLARKDPVTGYSTSTMIGGFASGFGGIGNNYDQNGHFVRFPAAFGPGSSYIPCSSNLIDPGAPSQLACDSFNQAVETYFNYLPPGNSAAAPGGDTK